MVTSGGSVGGFAEASLSEARTELSPEVYEAVKWAVEELGFRLRRQGHKFALYCPCEDGGGWLRVDGSPRGDPTNHAKRLRRAVSHCPDKHQLMR